MKRVLSAGPPSVVLLACGATLPCAAAALVGNLDQPTRATTSVPIEQGWAAQSSGASLTLLRQKIGKRPRDMHGMTLTQIADLMTTAGPAGHDECVGHMSHRRQQAQLSHLD